MMLMSEETKNALNSLVAKTFQMNSFCDNIAYDLDYSVYSQTSNIFHHSFAHKFPELADIITDLMIKLNARPIREKLDANVESYEGNLELIFADLLKECEAYRSAIINIIEVAEYNDDFEVKIEMENFLNQFMPYLKQSYIWYIEAGRYKDDYKSFDVHIETFTNQIPIVK